ncbi:MAG TPA: hypothetical protein VJM33_07385, partial [Microthrixaceae bacterium]|nr:hypothetical protein [Microthrixaceae bacterium]
QQRLARHQERLENEVVTRRDDVPAVDLAVLLYERDREVFASVLGSAIALRLFLFTVPLIVTIVGIANLFLSSETMGQIVDGSGMAGSVAKQIEGAIETSRKGGLLIVLTGIFLSLLAGRGLTKVLAACSAGAWHVSGRAAKATSRTALTVTGFAAAMVVCATLIVRARELGGVTVYTSSIIIVAAIYAVGWFAITLSLPRTTTDPGSCLPGAALVGLTLAGLQTFMQVYLPSKIERSSQLMGSVGVTVAVLGYLFIMGRVMAGSLVMNAVVFERFGSVTHLFFALPLVRKLPPRSPKLRHFFDLPDPVPEEDNPEVGPSADLTPQG